MNAKIKSVIASAVFVFAAAHPAFSSAAGSDNAGLTREQVRAELARARAAGELDFNDTNYPVIPPASATLTRAEVKADLARARLAGELDVADTSFPFIPKEDASHLTRGQVRSAFKQARDHGELDWSDTSYPLTVHAGSGN